MQHWIDRGLRVAVDNRAGILRMDLVGLVTADTIRRFVATPPDVGQVYAVLASFEKAIVCMKAEDMGRLFDSDTLPRRFRMPGAIVCNVGDRPVFNRHARQVAERGVTRVVFTDAAPAHAWTQAQASAARLAALLAARQSVQVLSPGRSARTP